MAEPVRLIIWDLDDTFWKGTLAEGGIEYQQNIHDIVVKLAERGIISSICSKNDREQVKTMLLEHAIWDYFVFPSINWEPKGQRIQALIDLMQLRPASCMLIDDNPMNLNEAKHYVPTVQVANETIIPTLLDHDLFRGKDDRALTRLRNYRLLERRKTDAVAAGADNLAFLRASKIRVEFEQDVGKHIDRAIELINRTNQLNFTKRRLPEDIVAARAALLRQIGQPGAEAALIRVTDRYGDYGFCGFTMTAPSHSGGQSLEQFCFSCRILNMGVETWLYRRLGRPALAVAGAVLMDVFETASEIDWITEASSGQAATQPGAKLLDRVILRGGCDLRAMEAYFSQIAHEVAGEYNGLRDGVEIRTDHSAMTRLALDAPGAEIMVALQRLGYRPEDIQTRLTDLDVHPPVVVLSFVMDAILGVFRHRNLGFRVTILLPYAYPDGPAMDATQFDRTVLPPAWQTHWIADALDELRLHYEHEGETPERVFKDNLSHILASVQAGAQVYIIGGNDRHRGSALGSGDPIGNTVRQNRWIQEVVAAWPNATLLPMRDFIYNEEEVDAANPTHFHRMVYWRAFEHIRDNARARQTRDVDHNVARAERQTAAQFAGG